MSRHIAIEDFAADMAGTSSVSYGSDRKKIVSALQRFADLVEKEDISLCFVKLDGSCDPNDFTTNTLIIKFIDYKRRE